MRHKNVKDSRNVWILKPSEGSCGNSIVLCDRMSDIRKNLKKMEGAVMIQKVRQYTSRR